MYSTPVLSNGGTTRGLPISCFLNYVDDSREGITDHYVENAFLSSFGGGIGGHWSDVRAQGTRTSKGSESTGVIPFVKVVDAEMLAFSQGVTRRGSYAAYLHMSHPEIEEFLDVRKPTGGDTNRKSINLHHGVVVPDSFMELIHSATKYPDFDDSWDLIDPHTRQVKRTVSARALWVKLLQNRMETGEPYIHYIDTSNREMPQFQKDLGLRINQSNLCSEIILPTNEQRTAVCCLSSVNLENYGAWVRDPQFLKDVAEMLDNVLTFFIDNAPDQVSRAKFSASRERSIGVGALGFHAYLQKNGIAWETPEAKGANLRLFRHIRSKLDEANKELGKERGEAPDAKGRGLRFSHVMAVAPNASSSIIMGNTSPSIEPFRANAYRQDTLSGAFLNKNKYLDEIIKKYCEEHPRTNYDEVWSSIISNDGSVQHLTQLTDEQKKIYKTSMEIDQRWLIEHAADRQEFIDQAQSLNLFFRPNVNIAYLHAVHFLAWKSGVKTLYYCRSEKLGKADKVSRKIERNIIQEIDMTALAEGNDCLACEG